MMQGKRDAREYDAYLHRHSAEPTFFAGPLWAARVDARNIDGCISGSSPSSTGPITAGCRDSWQAVEQSDLKF
jgi:hypothetical protein